MNSLVNKTSNNFTKTNKNSIIEKLQTLTKKTSNMANLQTAELLSQLKNSENIVVENKSYIFKFFKYLFIILLIGFVLLNILQALKLLPISLQLYFRHILLFFGHSVNVNVDVKREEESNQNKPKNNGVNKPQNTNTVIDTNDKLTLEKLKKDVNKKENKLNNAPMPNYSENSEIRKNAIGYCYVGTDRGYRSCIDVDDKNNCMSGEIFPTMDICINPNLRK